MFQHRQGHRSVSKLVAPRQINGKFIQALLQTLVGEPATGTAPGFKIQSSQVQGGTQFTTTLLEEVQHSFLVGMSNEGHSILNDSGLFSGDGAEGFPQEILMVQGNIGDNAHQWLHDVGGVQPPTHARFQDNRPRSLSTLS